LSSLGKREFFSILLGEACDTPSNRDLMGDPEALKFSRVFRGKLRVP